MYVRVGVGFLRQQRCTANREGGMSISQKPQRATHEHKRSHIPAPPHGQQTLRREATQAGRAKSESRER